MLEAPIPEFGDLRRQVQEALSSRDTRQRERELLQTKCHGCERQLDYLHQSNNPEVAHGAPLSARQTCAELLLASRQLQSLRDEVGNAAEELASAQEAVTAALEATRREAATSTSSMASNVEGDAEVFQQQAHEELASASKERAEAQDELHRAKLEMADAMCVLDSLEDSNMLSRLRRAKEELREQELCSELELEAERERYELELLKLEQRVSVEESPGKKNPDALIKEIMQLRSRLFLRSLLRKTNTSQFEPQDTRVLQPGNNLKYAQAPPDTEQDMLESVAQQMMELTTKLETLRAASSTFANQQVKDLVPQLRAQAQEFQVVEGELQPV